MMLKHAVKIKKTKISFTTLLIFTKTQNHKIEVLKIRIKNNHPKSKQKNIKNQTYILQTMLRSKSCGCLLVLFASVCT